MLVESVRPARRHAFRHRAIVQSPMSDRRAHIGGIGSGEPPSRWTKNLPNAPTVRALVLVTALKMLMVPCYRSTDFEVHRNWLAVTHSLPPARWYTENTSQWTLTIPCSMVERALASVAAFVDPGQQHQSDPYESSTVVFQQHVMAADVVLFIGVLWQTSPSLLGSSSRSGVTSRALALTLVAFSPGLLMVDHVHFQYNGMVIGLHVCALTAAHAQRPVLAAVLFSVLVHTKHIFAFAAPAMAAHLLAHHAWAEWRWIGAIDRVGASRRVFAFAASSVAVTALSFYPIWRAGAMQAMLARLFPFGRGLSHATKAKLWDVVSPDKARWSQRGASGSGDTFPRPSGTWRGEWPVTAGRAHRRTRCFPPSPRQSRSRSWPSRWPPASLNTRGRYGRGTGPRRWRSCAGAGSFSATFICYDSRRTSPCALHVRART